MSKVGKEQIKNKYSNEKKAIHNNINFGFDNIYALYNLILARYNAKIAEIELKKLSNDLLK